MNRGRAREALRALKLELEAQGERDRALLGQISSCRARPQQAKAAGSSDGERQLAASWADLDAVLASMRFSSCDSALRRAEKKSEKKPEKQPTRLSERVKRAKSTVKLPEQVVHCARRARPSTVDDRLTRLDITHKYMVLWRDLAQATAVTRNLTRRAASHHCDTLVRHAFHTWQLHHARHQQLSAKRQRVIANVNATVVERAYFHWRRVFRYQQRYQRLQKLQRLTRLRIAFRLWRGGARLSSQLHRLHCRCCFRLARSTLYRWFEFIDRCHDRRMKHSQATSFFLRCHWRIFVRNIHRRVHFMRIVAAYTKSLQLRRTEILYDKWAEFVDRRKRWRLAVKWDRQCILATALERWKGGLRARRFATAVIQRQQRRQRRRLLRRYLNQWSVVSKILHSNAVALQSMLERIVMRRALRCLQAYCDALSVREVAMNKWKQRQAIVMWNQRSQQQRSLTLRVATIAKHHNAFVKLVHGWRPWRMVYRRGTAVRLICSRRRKREIALVWKAFQTGVQVIKHRRAQLIAATAVVNHRRLQSAISAWADLTYEAHEKHRQLEQAVQLHSRRLLTQSWFVWKQQKRRKQQLNAKKVIADQFFATRMLQHWRAQVLLLQRQNLLACTKAKRTWVLSCLRRFFCLWQAYTRQQHVRTYRLAFTGWHHAVQRKKACRTFFEIGCIITLSRRWLRWTSAVKYNTQLHQIGQLVIVRHERHVKYTYFVSKWLLKARSYRLASERITSLSRAVLYANAIATWKRWKADQVKETQARAFHTSKLLTRYYKILRKTTIGRGIEANRTYQCRQIVKVWSAWLAFCERRKHFATAADHYRSFRLVRGVLRLRTNATRSQTFQALKNRAELWHTVVVLQTSMNDWHMTSRRFIRLRAAYDKLRRSYLGTRYLRLWQFAWIMRLKSKIAADHHERIVRENVFNAWRQITKRRLVAVAMLRYIATRIRLSQRLVSWKLQFNNRRQVRLAVKNQRGKAHARLARAVFIKWKLIVEAKSFQLIAVKENAFRWAKICWKRWRLYIHVERRQHQHRLAMVCGAFYRLRQYAIIHQGGRIVKYRSAVGTVSRALRLWRTEWRMARAQRSIDRTLLSYTLNEWARYTAACRQERKWIRYVQQLHRLHESEDRNILSKATIEGDKRDGMCTPEDYLLQRDLLRDTLHGWQLLTKNSQIRRRRKFGGTTTDLLRSIGPQKTAFEQHGKTSRMKRSNDMMLALRFWADRLLFKVFHVWKNHHRPKPSLSYNIKEESFCYGDDGCFQHEDTLWKLGYAHQMKEGSWSLYDTLYR